MAIEGLKIPSVGSIIRFVVLWLIVSFLVKLLVPETWKARLFRV